MTGQGRTAAMVRKLAWKEWREQRPIVLTGLAMSAVLPFLLMAVTAGAVRRLDLAAVGEIMPAICLALLWPLLAAAAGASTIAGEIGDGTLGFLLSRPASRPRIWLTKVTVGFCSTLLVLAGSLMIAGIVGLLGGSRASGAMLDALFSARGDTLGPMIVVSTTLLLFATSVFFSTFVSRPMTAAAAGLATGLTILAAMIALWSSLDLVPRLEQDWMSVDIGLVAAIILLASLAVFSRGELLRGSGARRSAAMVAAAAGLTLCLLSIPLVQAHNRLTPASASLARLEATPSGDSLVATVTDSEGVSPRIWLIHPDGAGVERLTGALTFAPSISPDGRSIAYLSMRGPLGIRASGLELRAMRMDGSGDRRLALLRDVAWRPASWRALLFSPDGTRLAMADAGRLLVASLDGGSAGSFELQGTPAEDGSPAAWTTDGREIVMAPRWTGGGSKPALTAVDARSGRVRVLFSDMSITNLLAVAPAPRQGSARIPVLASHERDGRGGGLELLLIDAASGRSEKIAEGVCYASTTLSDDGDHLAYAICRTLTKDDVRSEVHLRDLINGQDRVLATLSDPAGRILIAPSNDRLMVGMGSRKNGWRRASVMVTMAGDVSPLREGWSGLAWQGRDRLLVASWDPESRIGVMDGASGGVRQIFP